MRWIDGTEEMPMQRTRLGGIGSDASKLLWGVAYYNTSYYYI